ncbi:MAG: response regulator, partial [Pseudomonadales bacterium]|nr:response regulator [Pseudomonadales bacterium]
YPDIPVLTEPDRGGHVLVIDDQESVAGYLKEVLGQHGYEVTAITDANEALAVFHADPARFDLVITDQTMPGISGDQVMASIHKARPGLPVILCTGYSETIGERAARELGASGHLAKPLDTDRLLGLIHESLQP